MKPLEASAQVAAVPRLRALAERTQSSRFQSELVTRNEEGANVGEHRKGKRKHRLILLECTFCQNAPKLNPLILRGNGILMTYSPG